VRVLKEGKRLPSDYRTLLIETKKESELVYAEKEREENILADTMAVPLQKVKIFQNGKNGDWVNMLVLGDNLQVLKSLLQMKTEGELRTASGLPGIKLIYVDPPFATKQEFRGSQEEKAYQDKIAGSKFLEFLRKRFIFMRELLSKDGCIFVHLDWHAVHYVKIILDEVFRQENFRNEVYVMRIRKNVQEYEEARRLNTATDTILFYAKTGLGKIKPPQVAVRRGENWHGFDAPELRTGMDYPLFGRRPSKGRHWMWEEKVAKTAVKNYQEYEKNHSNIPIMEYWRKTGRKLDFLRANPDTGTPEYLVTSGQEIKTSLWDDISAYSFAYDFPTEKNERLLERIIEMASEESDLVADFFCGSGTTLAVAEKLGRRWIGVDCGKLATYTVQKRLLNLADSKAPKNSPKKYGKLSKPFALFNAGLYDYKMIKELPWERYRNFALSLFQCRDQKHQISKIELDGFLGSDHVMVFNYEKHPDVVMDRGFVDDLHSYLGDKIGKRLFIIAPAASVLFLEDYLEKDGTKYFVLRIPYSIVEELHDLRFTKIKQPVSQAEVNDTIDAVGFDFIRVPTVECQYSTQKKEGQLELGSGTKDWVIRIEKFESETISKMPLTFAKLETLSMVMLDYDFDGEVFNLDQVFFAEELKENGYEVRFSEERVRGKIMIVYIDIFGNEKREVKTQADFYGKRR
jgi:site-specific DNA-methyltransferase (adenine-specific)/adenine-specific DNA-methyltransferase